MVVILYACVRVYVCFYLIEERKRGISLNEKLCKFLLLIYRQLDIKIKNSLKKV